MAGVEVRAVQRHLRMSPQKVRLVLDVVRGKNAREALAILKFLPHRAARPVSAAIRSAEYLTRAVSFSTLRRSVPVLTPGQDFGPTKESRRSTALSAGDRDVPATTRKGVVDSHLVQRPAEDALDVLRHLREEVPGVGVVRASHADPIHHPAAVGMDQAASKSCGSWPQTAHVGVASRVEPGRRQSRIVGRETPVSRAICE